MANETAHPILTEQTTLFTHITTAVFPSSRRRCGLCDKCGKSPMCALCVFGVLGLLPSAWCRMTKAEQETIVRRDREDRAVGMWTADPAQARHWTRSGYAVTAVVSPGRRAHDGLAGGRPGGLHSVPPGAGRGGRETGHWSPEPRRIWAGSLQPPRRAGRSSR